MEGWQEAVGARLGVTLREARLKKRLSQAALAKGICSQPMISAIEKGDYLPNAAIFIALCKRLGLSVDKSF